MIQAYSQKYRPPLPVFNVLLSAPDENEWQGPLMAMIDTGADFTIVPLKILDPLNLDVLRMATLRSHWRDRRSTKIYEIDLRIGQSTWLGIEVAGDKDSKEIILGRNFLNKLDLYLNGPGLEVELFE